MLHGRDVGGILKNIVNRDQPGRWLGAARRALLLLVARISDLDRWHQYESPRLQAVLFGVGDAPARLGSAGGTPGLWQEA